MACCSRKDGAQGRQTVFGGSRPVTLDFPELFDGNTKLPLLILAHGKGMSAAQGRNTLGCQTAHQFGSGMLVVSLQGTTDAVGQTFFNATDACCNFYGSTVDDIGYGLSVIEEIIDAGWPVDFTRIGGLGYSNGGFYMHMLARCSNKSGGKGRITWAAALNGMGPLGGDSHACAPVNPVHWVQVNGTLDTTVAYGGDATGTAVTGDVPVGPYPGAIASAAAWAALNGVSGTLQPAYATRDFCQTIGGSESTLQAYSGAPPNGSVEVWTLVGEDHVVAMQTGSNPASSWTMSILQHFVDHPRVP